jgi:hypothetical protein
VEASGNARIDGLPARRLLRKPAPVSTVYILCRGSEEPEPGVAAVREQLLGIPAFEALVRHTFIAPLIGPEEYPLLLRSAAAIARGVSIYSLRFVRDLGRLPEVVDQLFRWHTADVGWDGSVGSTAGRQRARR